MSEKPNTAEKHDKRITVRLTEDQYRNMEKEADGCKLRVAVYARNLILGRQLKYVNPIVLDARGIEPAVAALGRVGNNLNQIARWLNRHTAMDDALRSEASTAFREVTECAHVLTELATEGVDMGVDAWRSLSTSR